MFRKKTALSLSRSFVTRIVRENIAKKFNISRNIFRVPAKKKTCETRNVRGTKNAPVKLSLFFRSWALPRGRSSSPARRRSEAGAGRAAPGPPGRTSGCRRGRPQGTQGPRICRGTKEKRKCGKTGTRILSYGIPVGAR